ncbi:hypothetical protein RBU61_04900 [Tissierella sp. MB52-C2]|uniref:hypothetical protein n=1 Tax=Tissierella sp. MB52-C2 TaxID=3070999 RepID=UPI00280B8AF0|nr:hypothetical protein [Tissierella sp. MB52-C2]WMM26015.1 hypothetical protein RBU61_04900 [Tissierella sp. MB52-C2]
MFNSAYGVIINDEINCPNNKYIKHFLWTSYFHDSEIISIKLERKSNQLVLLIESIYDIDKDWGKLEGSRKEKRKYMQDNNNRYIYKLCFNECMFFNHESYDGSNDFIFCYFKRSAKLKMIEKNTGKEKYHLRIVTSGGYIDIIFSEFVIKKVEGRIVIKDKQIKNYKIQWLEKLANYLEGYFMRENNEVDDEKLKRNLFEGDDMERCIALYYFLNYTNESIIKYAYDILDLDKDYYELSRSYAITAIGQQGSKKDIPILIEEYLDIERKYSREEEYYGNALLSKRHVMDAIEMINYCNMV